MVVQTNDGFFSPGQNGIELFSPDGDPVSGDVTDQVMLWDAGTEDNEAPGLGPNTGGNETSFDQGKDEHGVVRPLDDQFDYPAVTDLVEVSVTPR